jgi:hypothetical protein
MAITKHQGQASNDQPPRVMQGHTLKAAGENIDLTERTILGIASTIRVDRDGEIILPSAIAKRLDEFFATSRPMLAAHMHRSDDGLPTQIGWVESGKVSKSDFTCRFRFARTEPAEQWWLLASDPAGSGVQFSIGFLMRQWVRGTIGELVKEYPEIKASIRESGLGDSEQMLIHTDIELLEISVCAVASNPGSQQIRSLGDDAISQAVSAAIAANLPTALKAAVLAELEQKLQQHTNEIKAMLIEQVDGLRASMEDLAPAFAGSVPDREGSDDAESHPSNTDREAVDMAIRIARALA